MKYVVLSANGVAQEVIPSSDPTFPGIPINERYSEEFISACVEVADDFDVPIGWIWDAETKEFVEPPEPEPVEPPEEPEEPTPTDPVNPSVDSALEERVAALESAFDAMMDGLVGDSNE